MCRTKKTGRKQEEWDKREDEKRNANGRKLDPFIAAELERNIWYEVNEKPARFVIAITNSNTLVAAKIQSETNESVNKDQTVTTTRYKALIHNKTLLACRPVKIIIHKSPVDFLNGVERYTMQFVGSEKSGNRIIKHKTISEIAAELKESGNVLSDFGVENGLAAMVKAFEKRGMLEENTDMDFIGFFLVDEDKKIIASNMDIKKEIVFISDLIDALKFITELEKYYEGRLDLLATSIIWGMVAPLSFIFKGNWSFLKWLHFWGFPNATKSSTGKIILAIDGHQNDSRFTLNISNIDTIARLGEAIGKTTFPKLVDEVDLHENLKYIINQLKAAIENKILRSKFMNSKSSTAVSIPALSPLIMTSNPPPPYYDSAYMRRVIERSFSQSESHTENDPVAIALKELLQINLDRLKPLGDFRNWFIMNSQDLILDKKITPLELGKKILAAAYEHARMIMPGWFDKLLLLHLQVL